MHRSFLVCEIFRMICQNLLDSSAKRSLAALARTCRSFEGAALDLLWLEQTSLEPLILFCMPLDLWVGNANVIGVTGLRRPILSSDLTRFSYYSSRVKIYRQEIPCVFDHAVIHVLQSIISQSLCFPNIQVLQFGGSGRDFEWLPLFLGPHVNSIDLELVPTSTEDACLALSIFPRLKSQYPYLQHASITFNDRVSWPIPTRVRCVSDAILGWTHLRTLKVGSLDGSAWS
ncbi:hypothetical protein DFH09DRAFT_899851 [Mycena vulgaris]|nr:hypothetical protein DFH09DRAFT_899851 [Mycena vulgaris]